MRDSSLPGPDGFLVSPDDPLRAPPVRLNEYLLGEEQCAANAPFDMSVWRKLPKREIAGQIEGTLGRLRWLDQHDAELENAHLARLRLGGLLRALYTIKAPYTERDLRTLLDLTVPLLGRIGPYGPAEHVGTYLQGNEPELCASLRRFQSNLCEEMAT